MRTSSVSENSSIYSSSVCSPTSDINYMSVWEMVATHRDSYSIKVDTYVENGNPHEVHRLYMTKYIGKDAFRKLVKCPMIGGVRGSNYRKGINAFDIYDKPVVDKLSSIIRGDTL